jgi:hypothetical protein
MSKMLIQAHVLNWFADRALPSKKRGENSDRFPSHFSQCRHSVPLISIDYHNWLVCYSRDDSADSAIIHDFTRRLGIVLLLVYSSFQFTASGCPLLCILSSILQVHDAFIQRQHAKDSRTRVQASRLSSILQVHDA